MKFLILVLFCICQSVCGEVYKDFVPYMTIAQMKAKYPNAKFEIVKAAWVSEDDTFLKITGPGLAGTTYVATSKVSDSQIAKKIESYKAIIERQPDQDNSYLYSKIEAYESKLTLPNDERYLIDWLRWVPDVAFPFERIKAKFGEPDRYDYGESDFQPYAEWKKRGLQVNLSDDKKMVYSLEYYFTEEDYNRALGVDDKSIESTENKPLSSPKPKVKSKVKKTTM